jgi:protein TonB
MTREFAKGPKSEVETLTLALVLALVLHAAVITQLHFDWLDSERDSTPSDLDVVLVEWASEQAPEQADFLAQANQQGGGDNAERERPAAPPPSEPTGAEPDQPQPQPMRRPERTAAPAEVLTQNDSPTEIAPAEDAETERNTLPDASELLQQSRRIAQTAPDPLATERVMPRRPRRKFITANTREHLYASYMRAWVAKVERVGNMNYPERARQSNLEGSLVLSVDVLADGSIERVRVMRSSGYDLLDEAAVRIVRLAAPYAALPPDVREETDVLTITRTWQFSARGVLE